MRVAVVYNEGQPSAGGSWTFQRSILDALENNRGDHTFVHVDRLQLRHPPRDRSARNVSIKAAERLGLRRHRPRKSLVELAIGSLEVDCAWFLEPLAAPLPLPYVATVWDLAHRNTPAFPEVSYADWDWESREKNYRHLLPRAARVIAGTEAGKREIAHYYSINPGNISVLPFPVPSALLVTHEAGVNVRQKYDLRKQFIFYPARFWPHKNHANLLLAWKKLITESSIDLELVFTGSDAGNYSYIRGFAKTLDLEDRVRFLGFVSREDLYSLYREAFALVFPTFFGPDNIPPLEAFSMGCPVAASRLDGAEEQLADAALYFDPSDPSSIADALHKLWRDAGLRKSLVTKGHAIAMDKTPESYVKKMHPVLDGIAAIRRCWGPEYRSAN